MKILIVASMLGRDGTSRFITYLANGLSKQNGIKVRLLFFRKVDDSFLSQFSSNIEISCLGIEKKLWASAPQIVYKIIENKPDFCLFGFHQLLWMSFLRPLMHMFGIKLIFRDTIIPTLFHKNEKKWKKTFNKKAYQLFDRIIVQSLDMQDDLENNWGCSRSNLVLINNPVDVDAVREKVVGCPKELEKKELFTFVAAGRLTYQKGYDIIIKRMAELKEHLNFRLLILGAGEQYDILNELISKNELNNFVKLLGYKNNVADYLWYSDALLLCSRYEGFPNIVLEANALGQPVFTNNCPGGLNEIIIDGINGCFCDFEKQEEFEEGLQKFFSLKFDKNRITDATRERYNIDVIIAKYIDFFRKWK